MKIKILFGILWGFRCGWEDVLDFLWIGEV
jgi:hypothetical protein